MRRAEEPAGEAAEISCANSAAVFLIAAESGGRR